MRCTGLTLVMLLAVAGPVGAEPVVVTRDACARLVLHRPRPDVEYRAGVDVRGRPVPPADVGSVAELPLEIGMEIIVPWPWRLHDAPIRYRGEIYAGVVTVGPGGAVFLNGRPLSDPERDHAVSACSDADAVPR